MGLCGGRYMEQLKNTKWNDPNVHPCVPVSSIYSIYELSNTLYMPLCLSKGVVTPIRPVDLSATGIKMKSRDKGVNLC